ncbi:MAG: adenylate/guanylate cyclase domain-containing protein [Thermoplasmata archaeon]
MAEEIRRLAAVMFTDLAGYSALTHEDEPQALALLDEHRRIIRLALAQFGGREVKTIGDGFLIEFASALNAVRCAEEIQNRVHERNDASRKSPPIVLRVGIHLGDVVDAEGDLYGNAVNVAARIEPFSDPGGICFSRPVYDQVRSAIPLTMVSIGTPELKNIPEPLELFQVVLPWKSEEPPRGASSERSASAGPTPGGDATPIDRIVVLPFVNISADPGDDFFSDGMTEELIERLAHVSGLRVIARTTSMRYKNSKETARTIGRSLRVGTVVEGSVRKAGNRIRITVQMIDARTEEHLWSSRYDRPFDDIFAIQDDIAGQIASSISLHVSGGRREAPLSFVPGSPDTQDMEAYTNFLHGRKLMGERGSESTIRQALTFFEAAIRRDPQFARARVGIAEASLYLGGEGAIPYLDSTRRSLEELTKALQQNDTLAEAHSVLAGLLLGEDDMPGAEREARRAMELNPSLSDPHRWLAQLAAGERKIDEAVRLLEAAHQLDPVDVNVIAFLGRAYMYSGREADALAHWERTKPLIPFRTAAHLTEYYLALPDYAKAKETVRELERLRPDSAWTEMYRGFLAARLGDTEGARRAIDQLDRRAQAGELTVFFAGFVHFALGEMDAFVASMELAFQLHALPLMELMYSRLFEPARSDPRILDLLRRQFELRDPAH